MTRGQQLIVASVALTAFAVGVSAGKWSRGAMTARAARAMSAGAGASSAGGSVASAERAVPPRVAAPVGTAAATPAPGSERAAPADGSERAATTTASEHASSDVAPERAPAAVAAARDQVERASPPAQLAAPPDASAERAAAAQVAVPSEAAARVAAPSEAPAPVAARAPVVASPAAPSPGAPSDARAVAALDERATVLRADAAPADAAAEARRGAPEPAGPPAAGSAPTAESPARVAARNEARAARGVDLDGWWEITNAVDGQQRGDAGDGPVAYRVRLEHEGNRLTGRGFKWRKRDRAIPVGQRTPVTLAGTVDGARVDIELVEHRSRGPSTAQVSWTLVEDGGSLDGHFATTTGASGKSVAVKAAETPDDESPPARSGRRRRSHT